MEWGGGKQVQFVLIVWTGHSKLKIIINYVFFLKKYLRASKQQYVCWVDKFTFVPPLSLSLSMPQIVVDCSTTTKRFLLNHIPISNRCHYCCCHLDSALSDPKFSSLSFFLLDFHSLQWTYNFVLHFFFSLCLSPACSLITSSSSSSSFINQSINKSNRSFKTIRISNFLIAFFFFLLVFFFINF